MSLDTCTDSAATGLGGKTLVFLMEKLVKRLPHIPLIFGEEEGGREEGLVLAKLNASVGQARN